MANEKRLIDANERIKWLEDNTTEEEWLVNQYNADWIYSMLEHAPTVDAVEVVHGEWLDGFAVDHNGKKVYDSIDCSVCNDIFKVETKDREYWKNRFKVCPFCGAVMDGGNEDG